MKYSGKVYQQAAAALEQRREGAKRALAKRRETAFAACPELAMLESEIASAGIEVLRAIGMGENAEQFIAELAKHNLAAQERQAALLAQLGFAPDHLLLRHRCERCADSGFAQGSLCDCHIKLLRELSFAQLNALFPLDHSDFEHFSLDFYPDTPHPALGGNSPRAHMKLVLDFCRDYAQGFSTDAPSLFFHGETGLGKTHLSLAIAGQVLKGGYSVVYGSAQNLLSRLEKERFGNNRDSYGETEQSLLECELLILDDLGVEFTTQFTVAAIYNIINTRLLKNLPVIISTNLTPEELEQKYSRRVTSRIISCYASFLFAGSDIRQLKND